MKIFLKVVGAAALLLVLTVVAAVFFMDANQYREAIESTVADATGYELTIAGELDLRLFPRAGITLNDVRLRNPAYPQELASTTAVNLQVDAWQLFSGQLLVEDLSADDFHVNYFIDDRGNSIWEVEDDTAASSGGAATSATTTTTVTAGGGSSEQAVSATIQQIRIENASLDIQDLSRGSRMSIGNLNFLSQDSNLEGRAFPFELQLTYENNGMSEPVDLSLRSQVRVDPQGDRLALDDVQFSITPMLLQGQLAVENMSDHATISGNFQSTAFDLVGLLQSLGMLPQEEGFSGATGQRPPVAFAFTVTGNENEILLPDFSATVGDTELGGDMAVRFASDILPMNVSYDFIGGDLDITPFLSAMSGSPDPATGPESVDRGPVEPGDDYTPPPVAEPEAPLPFDSIKGVTLRGSVSLESLAYDQTALQDVYLFTNVEDGVLDIELQPASVFGGSVEGSVRVDANPDPSQLQTRFATSNLNIIDVAPSVSRLNVLTGMLNLEANHRASGDTVSALLQTLDGSINFDVPNNSVDISLIKQVFTAISALSPTGEAIQQWPDEVRFNSLNGQLQFNNGLGSDQQMRLRMDNIVVGGTGGLDLEAGSFDYLLDFAILGPPEQQTIPINPLYHDVAWPVQCAANFADEVSQYCRPDFNRAREIFAQIGTNAVRQRLQEEITDQVPEDLQDAARGLLRGLLN